MMAEIFSYLITLITFGFLLMVIYAIVFFAILYNGFKDR
jgi:hypothetical protein